MNLFTAFEGKIECHTVEPGMIVVHRVPDLLTRETLSHLEKRWAEARLNVGHDQWITVVVGPDDDMRVVGPEGMKEVLATMSRRELEQLAAMGGT